MHGSGVLVYPKERRFAVGTFHEGKPVKLDEHYSYRLDTKSGNEIYTNFRKKLHSEDP